MLKIITSLCLLSGLSYADPSILEVKYKTLSINGKTAKVITLSQPNGTWGYLGQRGESFDLIVKNELNESTVIHWHGLDLPNSQDGTELTQLVIPAHGQYHYNFPLMNSGTFWMHSHYELQEASLAAAPLIIESADDRNYQQVVVMFQDFSFKSPAQLLKNLSHGAPMPGHTMTMDAMDMDHMNMDHMNMSSDEMETDESTASPASKQAGMPMAMDLNDVPYDAFLTNSRPPQTPQLTQVKPGAKVKLRFINATASSSFWLNLGHLTATAVAVDGHPIKPLPGNKFQLAEAQRIDLVVTIPKSGGTFPILGQVEGLKNQSGLILTTKPKPGKLRIAPLAKSTAPALNDQQELKLQSAEPLPAKPIDKVITYTLSGGMSPYQWQINNQSWPKVTPAKVEEGQRVELVFINNSMMAHPMHLHGYSFQVVEVNQHKVQGAIRDSILILPHETVKVIFDATVPGKWFLHCHIAWHMPTGMMTYLEVTPATK